MLRHCKTNLLSCAMSRWLRIYEMTCAAVFFFNYELMDLRNRSGWYGWPDQLFNYNFCACVCGAQIHSPPWLATSPLIFPVVQIITMRQISILFGIIRRSLYMAWATRFSGHTHPPLEGVGIPTRTLLFWWNAIVKKLCDLWLII